MRYSYSKACKIVCTQVNLYLRSHLVLVALLKEFIEQQLIDRCFKLTIKFYSANILTMRVYLKLLKTRYTKWVIDFDKPTVKKTVHDLYKNENTNIEISL